MQPLTAWRPSREDWRAMLLIALVPLLLALPQLTPWLTADPMYYAGKMAYDLGSAIQRGVPYVDPNNGFQTQALGYRAALDWLSGEVPWWNPYSGIGMPLAAEYQPSAFFPLTFLLLLPRGSVLLQMALQVLSGLGTFALLRQLGCGRLAATTGGVLYAVNGTLALFAHGPASVVPSLPWILLGIERARIAAHTNAGAGWRVLAIAMAASLLAGFPETAFINGLLALAWAIVRGFSLPRATWGAYAARIGLAAITALFIAAPQVMSFLGYLKDSDIGEHAGRYAHAYLPGLSLISAFFAPYFWGPIFAYAPGWPPLYIVWGCMGGFTSIALIAAALHGFLRNRDALGILLACWVAAALAKTVDAEPFASAWNLIPGIAESAFYRYAPPTWELALVVLACRGLDSLERAGPSIRHAAISAICVALAIWAVAIYTTSRLPLVPSVGSLSAWMAISTALAMSLASAVLLLLTYADTKGRVIALAFVLAGEATALCFIPVLSNPRGGTLDMTAVSFLRDHLGLQRFYTLGPIAPNYGAYFGIASINHNYLPVPKAWVHHVATRLDRQWSESSVFNGDSNRNSQVELRANLAAYAELGVKYLLTHSHQDPLAGVEGVKEVYSDRIIRIFELPRPAPYFEAVGGACRVDSIDRRNVRLQCEAPALLVRRELYYPGWSATLNGAEASIAPHDRVFQAISIPRGASDVRFAYAPPHIGWAWLAAFIGFTTLAAGPWAVRLRGAMK